MDALMVDIETTGTDPYHNAMVQLAAIEFNYRTGDIGRTFNMSLEIPRGRYWDEDCRNNFWRPKWPCQRHCKNPRKWQSKIPHSRFWRSGGWWRASIFGWAPAAAWFDECGRSNWRVCPDVLRQEIGMAAQAIA